MVVYTFKTPKLFLLHFLQGFAEAFEGIVAVMTLGCVRFHFSYNILFKVTTLEMEERQKAIAEGRITLVSEKHIDKSDPWPRWQIWPPYRRK